MMIDPNTSGGMRNLAVTLVGDLPPRPHATVEAGDAMWQVVEAMKTQGRGAVLVQEDGALVGIFTDRDAILKVAGQPIEGRTVGEVMTHDPVILRSGDPVAVAIHKMAVGGFRHVPIVKGGVPVGVVSARDVFRHLAADLG